MTRWARWLPRAGSLRGFLLWWLLGGIWLGVAALTLWQAGLSSLRLAQAQDERLLGALAEIPQRMAQVPTLPIPDLLHVHVARAPPGEVTLVATHYRVGAMNGDWVSGDQGLAAFPWRATLSSAGAPALYVTHIRGTLMRAAAAIRHVPGDAAAPAIVVQVAAPWRERLPGWRELFAESPLAWVGANAVLASLVVCSGVSIALGWLGRARSALQEPAAAADYDGPSELRTAVHRMRDLHHRQHRWVEEQRRFLADASHQLRTPMAVLRTQLQSAIAGDVPVAEVLPQMLHTVDRATGLANQLLSLTKLEQIKRSGELALVDLHAAARDAVIELAPLVAAKRLDFALEGAVLWARGDAVMLGELLRNLLANAIHHAPANGRLGMLLRADAGHPELVVWDEGPGIDDAVRPRLFQSFSATQGGVGLGLSICKQIAEAMGASVALYNRLDQGRVIGVDAVVAWGQGP